MGVSDCLVASSHPLLVFLLSKTCGHLCVYMVKTSVSKDSENRYRVVIPKALGDSLDLEGTRLEWRIEDGEIVGRPD